MVARIWKTSVWASSRLPPDQVTFVTPSVICRSPASMGSGKEPDSTSRSQPAFGNGCTEATPPGIWIDTEVVGWPSQPCPMRNERVTPEPAGTSDGSSPTCAIAGNASARTRAHAIIADRNIFISHAPLLPSSDPNARSEGLFQYRREGHDLHPEPVGVAVIGHQYQGEAVTGSQTGIDSFAHDVETTRGERQRLTRRERDLVAVHHRGGPVGVDHRLVEAHLLTNR